MISEGPILPVAKGRSPFKMMWCAIMLCAAALADTIADSCMATGTVECHQVQQPG